MNLADTQYDVIEKVGEEMGWKLQYNESKTWDLKWNDSAITGDFLSKMSPHQKINHFPGMNTLHRKNTLAKNLYRLQEEHPEDYDFFPRTFLLPHDHLRLKTYFQETRKRGILKTFIVKPEANCQGRGIFLTQDINCTLTNITVRDLRVRALHCAKIRIQPTAVQRSQVRSAYLRVGGRMRPFEDLHIQLGTRTFCN